MSHQHRKLGESIRTAHYLKQVLMSEAKNSEYSRGVYNGFELISSILLNTEAKLILKNEGTESIINPKEAEDILK